MATILGQSRALEIITAALRSGRMHHAWIFSGPRGVGKFAAALEVARRLLDPEALADPNLSIPIQNPRSKIQNLIDSGTHPDLHIIRKELALYSDNRMLRERKLMNIPLDLLRERMLGGKTGDDRIHEAPAYRTAALGHGKVFIIDEAELLAADGQNAMLKTLEEPPPQTYIFLITNQPDKLLATLRSRCQHVRFGNIDPDSMRAWMRSHPALSTQPSALVKWVEQFAEGSPGLALLAIEYGFHGWHAALEPMVQELERGRFPVAMGAAMGEMVEEFAQAWVKTHGKEHASKDAANKAGTRYLLAVVGAIVRRRLAEAVSKRLDTTPWLAAVDLLLEAETQIESNVNLKLVLENLVVQWIERVTPVSS